jgi:hypothetical protein
LKLRNFEGALQDSLDVLAISPNNSKALFRKADALFGLHHYEDSLRGFIALKAKGYNDATIKIRLLNEILSSTNKSSVSDYIGPIKIQSTDKIGRGLFLTQDILANEIVLKESAFASAYAEEVRSWMGQAGGDSAAETGAGVGIKAFQRTSANSWDNARLSTLYDGRTPNLFVPDMDMFVVDGYSQSGFLPPPLSLPDILPIMTTNAFATERTNPGSNLVESGTGLWLIGSYINHSSSSNCVYQIAGDMLVVRSRVALSAGTQLTITYIQEHGERESSLKSNWNIMS